MKRSLQSILFSVILFLANNAFGQAVYLKPNEINLVSFKTANGKRVAVVIDTLNRYMMYRFGTARHIEFEYPKDQSQSYKLFKWYYNICDTDAGTNADFYTIYFVNGGYSYKIYNVEHDDDGYNRIQFNKFGVIVTNNVTNKEHKIKGLTYLGSESLILLNSIAGPKRSQDPF